VQQPGSAPKASRRIANEISWFLQQGTGS